MAEASLPASMPAAASAVTPSRLFIVEDEWIVATDIGRCLERAGFVIAGIAHKYEDARRAIGAARPDLALLDIALGDSNDGVSLARQIWTDFGVPAVMVTAYADDATISRATTPGVVGYLVKPFEDRQLVSTVKIALSCAVRCQNQHVYDTRLSAVERGLDHMSDLVRRIEAAARPISEGVGAVRVDAGDDPETAGFRQALVALSAREREVLDGLLDNRRVSSIADTLFISQHTVRNHLKAVFKKLGVRSQAQVIEACRRAGVGPHAHQIRPS